MNNITKRNALITIVSCLIVLFVFSSCNDSFFEREYYDDVIVALESRDAEIVLREWSWLSGSGAEVYYKEDGKEIKLGQTTGGDNGYCPIKNGMYRLSEDGDTVTIEWLFRASGDLWQSKTFDLPLNKK